MAESHFSHNFTAKNDGKIDTVYKMDIRKAIGEGSYGQVVVGTVKGAEEIKRAIKSIDKNKVADPKRFQQEVNIQAQLDHPNIVKCYEWFEDAKRYYIVMEMCDGGELFDRIIEEVEKHDGTAFTEAVASGYMSQILAGMNYLHNKHIAHRDIKPENFLLQNKSKDADIKVIDFGLAKKFNPGESKLTTKAGTPYYVAPEVLKSTKDNGYNEKCDIWSCGVLAYIMLCGYPPFYGDRDSDILKMVKTMKFDFPKDDWDKISKEAKEFISRLLVDVTKRPSAEEALNDVWFSKAKETETHKLSGDLSQKLKGFSKTTKLKKVALTIIAKNMSEDELKTMQDDFKLLDKNSDGTLTVKEMIDGMKNAGLKGATEDELSGLDTDGSGQIDYTEFLAACISQRGDWKKEKLWQCFRQFDKDGNGTIEAKELQTMLSLTEPQVRDLIAEVDTNHDGMIDFEEFQAMMKN